MVTKDNDAIGVAIKEFLSLGDTSKEITVLSDEFDDDVIPVHYLFRKFKDMPILEQEALLKCKGKILDVGAGAACHSVFLQEKGEDVTALEISQMCAEEIKKQGLNKVIRDDFFNLKTEVKYDTILMLMNGIGIVGTLDKLDNFFVKVKELLKPGGCVIFDSSDVSYLYDSENNIDDTDKYFGEFSFAMKYDEVVTEKFHWLYVDIETIKRYASNNGFTFKLLYEDDHFGYLGALSL
ncbi:class I SAM-dependent methyltransferase [Bacteroidales bacterium]|nr:class I SAM-dependent methyltransferase [Bacteroidales bacterium]